GKSSVGRQSAHHPRRGSRRRPADRHEASERSRVENASPCPWQGHNQTAHSEVTRIKGIAKGEAMEGTARLQRLFTLVAEAKVLVSKAQVHCMILSVLDALTDNELQELGTRHLNRDRHRGILDRLSQTLAIDSGAVWQVLSQSMAWDL